MPSSAIDRILVPIKYPDAETPLSVFKAIQLARGLHAELALFHAINAPAYAVGQADSTADSALAADPGRIRERLLHSLTTQAASLGQQDVPITVAAEWDYPAHEATLRHAHRVGAGLIVTERHALAAAGPQALHSTDWELLRLSAQPVLIVKDQDSGPYQQPVIVAAIDPSHRHAKPADLDAGICALAQAISTALAGSWCALHAYASGRTQASAAVAQVLQSAALQPRIVLLRDTAPADAIIEATRELGASLLVMGALSRSGVKRLLIGNTAEEVIDRVCCDVLVVKPERFGIHFPRHMQGSGSRSPGSRRMQDPGRIGHGQRSSLSRTTTA